MNLNADIEVVITNADGSTTTFMNPESIRINLKIFNNTFTYTKTIEDIIKEKF